MNQIDRLLTAKEVAASLRISVPTLYRMIQKDELPKPYKFGSLSRWPQSEILAALQAAGERRQA